MATERYSRISTPRPGCDAQFRGSQVPNHGRIVSLPSPRHMADLLERVRASLAGRYTIERELGRGGMATVYRARDLKHDRPVALKVLRPELAAVLGADRFLRREAKAGPLASGKHSNATMVVRFIGDLLRRAWDPSAFRKP